MPATNSQPTILIITGVSIVITVAILLFTEISSTYLRTAAIPVTIAPISTTIPSPNTIRYSNASFSFAHPINWQVITKPTSPTLAGLTIQVGTISLYSFPYAMSTSDLQKLRTNELNSKKITSWPCIIGTYQATCWAKANTYKDTTAPVGPRLVEFKSSSKTLIALIPAPPRSRAEQSLINSLQINN